ncbi:MAG TPA: DsbE family thiol:disulfide interchange protein [Caldimonas sp.]|nr:DsbE family thiol:disulfide interchange protein [Caldimonas sp.]
MKRFLLPLVLFLGLAVFLAVGLTRDPRELPSPLIGRAAPAFELPRLGADGAADAGRFGPADMRGKVWLLNVWASWCVSCRQEHPVLLDIARRGDLPLIGLDYKDTLPDARAWLAEHGNPYQLSAVDADGRVGIDYGVYGVPETYLIDKAGTIRYKQIGPLTAEVLEGTILPLVKELRK